MTVTDAGVDGSELVSVDERDDLIARRIREWQTRLLQLDRRNNLLYFKPGRSAVGITEIGPDELDRRLQTSRSGLSFTYAERRQARKGGVEQVPGRGDADEPGTEEGPRIIAGELHTDCEPVDLQRRLRNLWRRDREWHAEQGLNILFLAAGFLDWVDAGGEPARAPLLLIPCDLVRKSPRDPFRLVREDDDAVVNPTLRHQLGELGIELPELDDESGEGEGTLAAYIASVGLLAGQRPDWSVDSALVLGAFSFSKLAMYEDLSRMLEHGVQNPLTRQLAGDAGDDEHVADTSSAAPSAEELAGGRLDELLDVRDQHAILPADFSQLRAIQQARTGTNLVIHGPPGTGKSQTIANLIATLLADGKRVLFVSEKMAALDVVKRRLEQCGLGAFCLDLHSDRGRKREVYNQLGSSLADERERIAASVPLDELIESRDRLNRVVRRLHQRRELLGLSVYEVQGRFAPLRELPRCEDIEVPGAAELDQEWLREANRRAEGIAPRTAEFRAHDTSRWLALRTPQPSFQLADLIRREMALVQPSVEDMRAAADPVSAWLGLPAVECAADTATAIEVLKLLQRAPAVPAPWLEQRAVAGRRQTAAEQADQQRRRRELEEELRAWFGGDLPSIDYRTAADAVELSMDDQEALAKAVGRGWRRVLGADPTKFSRARDVTAQALDELLDCVNTTAQLSGQEPPRALASVAELSTLAKRILALDPVPEHWLDRREADVLKRDTENARSLLRELTQAEERLRERYSDALAELVDEDMLIRYRTDHQSFWRRKIGGAFRRDQRVLRGQLKVPSKPSVAESLHGVEQALEVQRLRQRWNAIAGELIDTLGSRFDDRETDWERVAAHMTDAGSISEEWNGDSTVLWELLAAEAEGRRRRELERSQHRLDDATSRFKDAAAEFGDAMLAAPEREFRTAAEILQAALDPLRRVARGSVGLYQRLARPIGHYHQLTELIEHGVQLMRATEEAEAQAPQLASDFGSFFKGGVTDWATVSRALDWSEQLLDHVDGQLSTTLLAHSTDPQPPSTYAGRQHDLADGLRAFRQFLNRLDQRFDAGVTSWRSWEQAPLAELVAWSNDLAANAGEAASWVEYRDTVQALDEQLGTGATSAIRARTEAAADVPKIVRSRIYESWLEQIYASEPELREFSRVNHEQIRTRFRALDQALPLAARQRVRERVFAGYPEHRMRCPRGRAS